MSIFERKKVLKHLNIIFSTLLCLTQAACSQSISTRPMEWPAVSDNAQVYVHTGYATLYNRETMIPDWVAWELTADEVNPQEKLRGKESFRFDPNTKGKRTAYREDYRNDQGWQRGHMAPKADMRWSTQAYEETFYLSNICPQNGDLNSGDWANTESLARRMATRYGSVYVVCGPIIGSNRYGTLGDHKVVIPDAFFKALLLKDGGRWQSIGMVLPNDPTHHDPDHYWCTVNELEAITGLDLFPGLDDSIEETTESTIDRNLWAR